MQFLLHFFPIPVHSEWQTRTTLLYLKLLKVKALIIKYLQQLFEDIKKCSELLHCLCLKLSIEKTLQYISGNSCNLRYCFLDVLVVFHVTFQGLDLPWWMLSVQPENRLWVCCRPRLIPTDETGSRNFNYFSSEASNQLRKPAKGRCSCMVQHNDKFCFRLTRLKIKYFAFSSK